MTKIIINADDYGFCDEVDGGILSAAREGLISSVAAFANGPEWQTRLRNLKNVQDNYNCGDSKVYGIDIGCHLTITSGMAISKQARESRLLTNRSGRFYKYTQLRRPDSVSGKKKIKDIVKAELMAQLDQMDRANIDIAHLSSHHDALTFFRDYYEAVLEVAQKENIPVRSPVMLPETKEWLYYNQIGLRLKDNLSKQNEMEYRKFRKNRKEWFNSNVGSYGIPKGPDILDGSNYVVRSQFSGIKHSKHQDHVAKSKLKQFKTTLAYQDVNEVTEYCVHLCSPTISLASHKLKFKEKRIRFRKNPEYYFGVAPGYFDGRQIEYKTLELLKPEIKSLDAIEVVRWKDIK